MPRFNRRQSCSVERLEPRKLLSSSFPNVNISKLKGNQAEGAISIDPLAPSKAFAVSNIDSANGIMAATSTDGGATWTSKTIATNNSGLPVACCDVSTTFDSFGNLYLTYLNTTDNQVELLLSTDAGNTFTVLTQFNGNVDQPTVATGPGSVWLEFDRGNSVSVTGAPVVSLGSVGQFRPLQIVPGSGNGQFGDIAVGSSGQVMVTWQSGGVPISVIKVNVDATGLSGSFNRFATVVSATHVTTFDYIPAQETRGVDAETGLAFDTSSDAFNGRVYLVYTNEFPPASQNTDIFLRYSDNNGITWSAPIRVNDDPGVNSQFLPRVSLDSTSGKVAVSWYDARNDTGTGSPGDTDNLPNDDAEFYAAVITPQADGLLVSANQQIAAAPSNAYDANSQIDFGDYTGLDFYNGVVHPLWFDNSNSTGDNPNGTLNELNVYTASAPASAFAAGTQLELGGLTDSAAGPVASLTPLPALNPGFIRFGRFYYIRMTYSAGTNPASLGNANLLVTGPNGFSSNAELFRVLKLRGGVLRGIYRVSKPSGFWTSADIGTYTISLQPNSVSDISGNPAEAGVLGEFVVATGLTARTHAAGSGTRLHSRSKGH
jgi:hypothetical protein